MREIIIDPRDSSGCLFVSPEQYHAIRKEVEKFETGQLGETRMTRNISEILNLKPEDIYFRQWDIKVV
jgi:hypothetical protein